MWWHNRTCPCWVTALDHEVLDDPVEFGAVVVAPPSQLCKVLAGLWSMLPVQLQHDDPHAAVGTDSTGSQQGRSREQRGSASTSAVQPVRHQAVTRVHTQKETTHKASRLLPGTRV